MTVTAVVLAAGGSQRFGPEPKQLAGLDGRPLIEHAVHAALACPAVDATLVVLGADADRIEAEADLGGARTVRCDDWEAGLAASLRAGVAAAGAGDAIVILLADQPRVSAERIDAAVRMLDQTGADAVRTTHAGAPGHPVVLAPALAARAGELEGDAGARALLEADGVRVAFVEAPAADGADVDTPEDLAAVCGSGPSGIAGP